MHENTERGSFTIPKIELDKLNEFADKFVGVKPQVNRSEIIRVGIYEVIQKDKAEVEKILENKLNRLKVGKPKKTISIEPATSDQLTVNDKQWQELTKVLEAFDSETIEGRPKIDYRNVIDGILYIFRYKKQRRKAPDSLASFTTCWRRLNEWQNNNIWKQICNILLNNSQNIGEKEEMEKVLLRTFLIATKK